MKHSEVDRSLSLEVRVEKVRARTISQIDRVSACRLVPDYRHTAGKRRAGAVEVRAWTRCSKGSRASLRQVRMTDGSVSWVQDMTYGSAMCCENVKQPR